MRNRHQDIRSPQYRERIKKYRKVIPPDLLQEQPEFAKQHQKATARNLSTGLNQYTGEWTEAQVLHLLKRSLFGVKKEELNRFKAMTLDEAVAALLTPSTEPSPPVNNYLQINDGNPDPDVPEGESWVLAPFNEALEGGRIISLKGWLIKNMVEQEASLSEKLLLFWHNLLAIQSFDVFVGKACYTYFKMLRRNSLGNYKTMVRELTLDPAMLLFLNGTFNNKEQPDENYARELQELFTVGKGSGSQYTEEDVVAAARVLTGWVINWQRTELEGEVGALWYADWHDTGDKQFSAFYGNKLIKGRSGFNGSDELDELLDMIFATEEAAKYIIRRLYNFFVFPEIDATTEANIIEPLATIFRDGGYEIAPVLETLLKSEHFFDAANRGAIIKSPADFLIGTWRTLNFQNTEANDPYTDLWYHLSANWTMANGGQEIGDPPSVAGWPAYYQEPQFDKSWMTTDTVTKRALHTDSMVYWGFWVNEELQIPADLFAFVESLDSPEDPNSLIAEANGLLMGIPLDGAAATQLKTILLAGQGQDFYWTDAWNLYQAAPTSENRSVVENRLKPLFQALFQLSEHQLM